jgi:hypothetical protein
MYRRLEVSDPGLSNIQFSSEEPQSTHSTASCATAPLAQ